MKVTMKEKKHEAFAGARKIKESILKNPKLKRTENTFEEIVKEIKKVTGSGGDIYFIEDEIWLIKKGKKTVEVNIIPEFQRLFKQLKKITRDKELGKHK